MCTIYGQLMDDKRAEVSKLLCCGDFRNGFWKHTCPACGTALMVAFTCKSRLPLLLPYKAIWMVNL